MAGVDTVLARLRGVKRKGSGHWVALCPLHSDEHPSLDIRVGRDGKPLIYCRVCGGKTEIAGRILDALDLTWADILGEGGNGRNGHGHTQPKPRIVATFDYVRADGELVYQSCRVEPGPGGRRKSFFQRRPGASGGWVNDLEGVERVLYRLPELLAADPAETVWVPEGEAKVDQLRGRGLVATCGVGGGGSGKWLPTYSEVLRGRRVHLLPDNDEAGRVHVAEAAKSLDGIAAEVRIVELPGLAPKGDIIDWFAAGHTRGELEALAAMAVPVGRRFADPVPASLLRRGEPGGNWLWHGYFARQTVTLLSAYWKAGKTTLLAHLLHAMAQGGSFCGREVRPTRVLYVSEEPESLWAQRRDSLGIDDHVFFQLRPFRVRPKLADWIELLQHLRLHVHRQDFGLVVIDPLTTMWPVEKENDSGMVAEALVPLNMLTDRAGVALVHHLRKGDGQEATGTRGSGALPAFCDTLLELRRYNATDRKDCRRVLTGYGRFEETPDEMVVELTAGGYVTHGDVSQVRRRSIADVIAELLPAHEPGWTWQAVREAWPEDVGSPRTEALTEALQVGADAGRWLRSGRGIKGDPYRFWLPAAARENGGDEIPL